MRVLMSCAVWLITFGALDPVLLWAQRTNVLEGERVRIKKPRTVRHFYGWRDEGGEWIPGIVMRIDMNVVDIRPDGIGSTVSVPRDSVFRMEKSLGMTTRMKQGGVIGAVLGLAVGIGVAAGADANSYTSYSSSSSQDFGWDVSTEFEYGCYGLLIGFGVGTIVGSMLRVEQWEKVQGWDRYLPGMMHSMNVVPSSQGWQMCFSKRL